MKGIIVYGLGKRFHIFEGWLWKKLSKEYYIVGFSDKKRRPLNIDGRFIEVKEIAEQKFDILIITSDMYFAEIFSELHDVNGRHNRKY